MSATLGALDVGMGDAEDRAVLVPLLESLPERERKIILMRFFEGLTQSEIAARMGISQMHVSRLLARSLSQLREISEAS
jgi:RNA polymerase sigma-B factor